MTLDALRLGVDVALVATLLAIAATDWRRQRIPDRLSLPLIAAGLVWAALAGQGMWSAHAIGAVAGYGSLATFGTLHFRWRGREGLGLGDAKLFGAAGAWLGWQALPSLLLIAALAALAFAVLTGPLRRDRRVAFGPWLALGFLLLWLQSRWQA